ncbi:dienelactone hydrolase family protein [Halopelagius fulvigenes]|uniref:Dienelactone hydrolase family protein n=1 Tax=Halopelagius fulvigenes TaxID=1198324 RepID=A0ABD5TSD7_9EURY
MIDNNDRESERDEGQRHSRRTVLRNVGLLGALAGTGALASTPARAAKDDSGFRSADGGSPNPGPSLLYDEPVTAPQFENEPPWKADPLRVAGTEAYVRGEYLYQDYVYDDYGANTTNTSEPPQPAPNSEDAYGENGTMTGDVVYPTDEATYRHNAADLVEFRATRHEGKLRYRFTLNTMVEPDAAAVAVGIDTGESGGTDDWGYGIGTLGELGLDHTLVTWGSGAELDGESVESSVDLERNQIDVTVPLSPPKDATWRHYLVVGLWDGENERFTPVRELPDSTHPGGAHGQNPPPVFNVGFRFDEPVGAPNVNRETGEVAETTETGSRGIGYGHWRDHAQAKALAERDISELHADVDFGKLDSRVTDRRIPDSGFLTCLYSSRYDLGSGVDAEDDVLLGRIQPYGLYVPESYDGDPTALHLHLHSLGSTYSEYAVLSPNLLRQLGERRDSLVLTPEGRGPAGWYHDEAELDVFEAWNDAARRFAVDEDRVTVGGYSMGAFGTFRLGGLYPDLFARAFAVAGGAFESETYEASTPKYLDGFRNLPVRMWNGSNDKLVPAPVYTSTEQRLRELEYRHELDVFPGYDHFTFAFRDQWGPARDFLGTSTVPESPVRVVYRPIPAQDAEQFGLVHDGAYWVSGVRVADGAADGRVDVRSHAFGETPPVAVNYEREGTEPAPHTKHGTEWTEPTSDPPKRNALSADLDRVSEATIWVKEAGLDPAEPITLTVDSTDAATVTLATEQKEETVEVPSGHTETTVTL